MMRKAEGDTRGQIKYLWFSVHEVKYIAWNISKRTYCVRVRMNVHIAEHMAGGPTRQRCVRGRLFRPLICEILLWPRLRCVSMQQCSRPLISLKLLSEGGYVKKHTQRKTAIKIYKSVCVHVDERKCLPARIHSRFSSLRNEQADKSFIFVIRL